MVAITSCHSSEMKPLLISLAAVFHGTSQLPKQLLYNTISCYTCLLRLVIYLVIFSHLFGYFWLFIWLFLVFLN